MPDIREIKNALFGQMELNWPDIKFNGSNQGYGGQEHKIGNDEYLACPVVPELYEFYL
jgi:hypothetical protein